MNEFLGQFDAYRITNGRFKKEGKSESVELGCTGSVSVESETRTITKTCEGVPSRELTKVTRVNGTFVGHMPVEVLREAYGLTDEDLKTGIYGYKNTSSGGSGALTWDIYDMTDENIKRVAFPNVSWTGGLNWTLENGQEEVAQVEIPFTAMVDENGYFYYETYNDEAGEEVISGWNDNFNSKLVKAPKL